MQGVLYEENSALIFVLVTVVFGGWLAWMTGRALALTWRSFFQLGLGLLALAAVVRFIHFALFGGTLLSGRYYLVDLLFLIAFGLAGFRATRTTQMTRQYPWLYERTGPLTWRERDRVAGSETGST